MRILGLQGICPKRWRTTTDIDGDDAQPVDAVARQWDTGALNQVGVGAAHRVRDGEQHHPVEGLHRRLLGINTMALAIESEFN